MSKKPTNRAASSLSLRESTPNLQEQRRMHALSEAIRSGGISYDSASTVATAKAFEGYLSGKAKE